MSCIIAWRNIKFKFNIQIFFRVINHRNIRAICILISFILFCAIQWIYRFKLLGTILFNYIYFIRSDCAVITIFLIVDKLECPYHFRISVLSFYDRCEFQRARALPVFKSFLSLPFSLSYVSEYQFHRTEGKFLDKRNKVNRTHDDARGIIWGRTRFQHTKENGRGNVKARKRRRKCYCYWSRCILVFYETGCASESR